MEQDDEEPTIILEKRLARWMNGCGLIVAPIGLIVIGFVDPQSFFVAGISLAIPYLLLLGKHFSDRSDKGNIVITPTEIRFGKSCGANGPGTISWNELGDVQSATNSSTIPSSSGGDMVTETGVLYLSKKGSDETEKPYQVNFSRWGGRFVKGHMGFYNGKRAIELIIKLRDAASEEERIEIIKNGKGRTRIEHKRRKIPFRNRKTMLCKVCVIYSVYDTRIPKFARKCPSCGSNKLCNKLSDLRC